MTEPAIKFRKGHRYRINRGGYRNTLVEVIRVANGLVTLEFPGATLYTTGKPLRHEWRADKVEILEHIEEATK